MSILGLDIGGANIKAADASGRTLTRPFAIWKTPEQLGNQVAQICREFPAVTQLAVTMTAELADCYATKAEGVTSILDQVESVPQKGKNQRKKQRGQDSLMTLNTRRFQNQRVLTS